MGQPFRIPPCAARAQRGWPAARRRRGRAAPRRGGSGAVARTRRMPWTLRLGCPRRRRRHPVRRHPRGRPPLRGRFFRAPTRRRSTTSSPPGQRCCRRQSGCCSPSGAAAARAGRSPPASHSCSPSAWPSPCARAGRSPLRGAGCCSRSRASTRTRRAGRRRELRSAALPAPPRGLTMVARGRGPRRDPLTRTGWRCSHTADPSQAVILQSFAYSETSKILRLATRTRRALRHRPRRPPAAQPLTACLSRSPRASRRCT